MTIFKSIKRVVSTLGLVGLLTLPIGCGGGGGNGSTNHNPNFTSTPVTTGIENSVYSYDADADDPDTGDTLTYSLTQSPSGMTINSTSGLINWTPNDSQSGTSHDITVRVEDGNGGSNTQNYTINVTNTETISGYVSDALNGNPLENIDVVVGSFSDATDSGGYWEIQNIPDGDHVVSVSDSTLNYDTFKPGFFRVSKTSKLEQDCMLIPGIHRSFVNDTIRHNGEVRKWKSKPVFNVYRLEQQSGADVGDTKINEIKDIIKTELTQFANDSYDFSDSDINIIATKVPGQPSDGEIYFYWDNSFGSGANASWFDGNEVKRSFAHFNTSNGKSVEISEMTCCLIGDGETTDAAYNDSIFYDLSTATSYSNHDLMLSELVYGDLQRVAGNKDYGTPDNHDRNPDSNQWNLGFTGAKSMAYQTQTINNNQAYDVTIDNSDDCIEEETFEDLKDDYDLQETQDVF